MFRVMLIQCLINITSMFLFTLSVRRLRSQLGLMPTSIPPTTPYSGMSELIGIILGVNLDRQL